MRSNPILTSKKASVIWIDMRQQRDSKKAVGGGSGEGDYLLQSKGEENWWPGMRRWHLGMVCEDATLELGHPVMI